MKPEEQNYKPFGKPIDRRRGEPLPIKVEEDVMIRNAVIEPGTTDTNPFQTDAKYRILQPGERVAQIFRMRSKDDMTYFDFTKVGLRFKVLGDEAEGSIDFGIYDTVISAGSYVPDTALALSGDFSADEINNDSSLLDINEVHKWKYTELDVTSGSSPALISGSYYALVIENNTGHKVRITQPNVDFLHGYVATYDLSTTTWTAITEEDLSMRIVWSEREPLEITGDFGMEETTISVIADGKDDIAMIKGHHISNLHNGYFVADTLDGDAISSSTQSTEYNNLVRLDSTTELIADADGAYGNYAKFDLNYENYPTAATGNLLNLIEHNILRFVVQIPDMNWIAKSPGFKVRIVDEDDNYTEWEILKKNIISNYIMLPLNTQPTTTSGVLRWDRIKTISFYVYPSYQFYEGSGSTTLMYIESISPLQMGFKVDTEIGDVNIDIGELTVEKSKTEYYNGDGAATSFNLSNSAIAPLLGVEIYENEVWKDATGSIGGTAYNGALDASDDTLVTFTTAPPSGTYNVRVRYAPKFTGSSINTDEEIFHNTVALSSALETVGDSNEFVEVKKYSDYSIYAKFTGVTATAPTAIRITAYIGSETTKAGEFMTWDITDISEDDTIVLPVTGYAGKQLKVTATNIDSSPTVNYCSIFTEVNLRS